MLRNSKNMSPRQALGPDLVLFLATVILLFWGLGTSGLWGSEGRWAEIVREMFLTGDFFHPRIGGEPYFDKPLLTYWLIAGITAATGILNEWVVRMPSAVSGVAVIWATRWIGGRLWSAATGRLAAWILLSTYGFLFWGRTAAADMENLAAIMVAIAWYWCKRDQPSFRSFLVFYLVLSFGALCKGLTAVVVPLIAVSPDILSAKRWRMLLKPAHFAAGILGCIVYLAPFLYASVSNPEYHTSGLGLVFKENIVRFITPFDHKGPVYIYLYALPLLLLPWSPLFLAAISASVRSYKVLDSNARWLLMAIALIFLFFTVSGSRRSYYILPVVPLCALLVAVFVNDVCAGERTRLCRWGIGIQGIAVFGLVAVNLLGPVVLLIMKISIGSPAPLMLSLSLVSIGLTSLIIGRFAYKSLWVHRYLQVQPFTAAIVAIAVVVAGGYFCWQHNLRDLMRTERPMLINLKRNLAGIPPDRIGVYPKANATTRFYLGTAKPLRMLKDFEALRRFVEDERPGVLIIQQKRLATIPSDIVSYLDSLPQLGEEIRPWEFKSAVKHKWLVWFLHRGTPPLPVSK